VTETFRIHIHRCEVSNPAGLYKAGEYGGFFPEAISEIELWTAGWSRKPLYALRVTPKDEVTHG
jgi:hypothetical protein